MLFIYLYSMFSKGAIGALYGPLHGGANEAVLRMLERIQTKENVPKFIAGVKNKTEKLFGFGHRVYKNFDPRSKVIRTLAEEVFKIAGTILQNLKDSCELEYIDLVRNYRWNIIFIANTQASI